MTVCKHDLHTASFITKYRESMADGFGDDLFSAFDEDSSSSRPVPALDSRKDENTTDEPEDDSSKRLVGKAKIN